MLEIINSIGSSVKKEQHLTWASRCVHYMQPSCIVNVMRLELPSRFSTQVWDIAETARILDSVRDRYGKSLGIFYPPRHNSCARHVRITEHRGTDSLLKRRRGAEDSEQKLIVNRDSQKPDPSYPYLGSNRYKASS